ncbi:MAG: LptF/LptG family permease [Prevotella sp.]|nr:LptF/LptG family permease [Prevotella sp.]MBP3219863.1 LptF/LptG family permease [Prevotella sp.]
MFRIRKLDLFISKQFGLLFVGTFFICQFVLMMQFLWRYVDELIGKGLSLEILGKFFWYMGLMLVPQALPLAILLSSLITFGNLGESSELTAIKAAGISLMQAFRSLIVITIIIMLGSLYFQNVIGPRANMSFTQLLISMKQKSPELEIPEGIFYDGIPNTNLYVQKKDLKTGMLYGIMIYRMTGSYEDAAIILADSGMMQSTAEKKHLLLTLHSGEWFENMRSQDLINSANVPYRRETFSTKRILLDFDSGFSLTDADLRNNAQGKSWAQLMHDVDSMNVEADSLARANYATALRMYFHVLDTISKKDSIKAVKTAASKAINIDTLFNRLDNSRKQMAVSQAMSSISGVTNDLEFKAMLSHDTEARIRMHRIEAIGKFTLALSCLIFFFIGAPLGAIIRKGGLGVPVIISVLVFIIFYIFDNTGYRMARLGAWPIWFGKGIATAVLTPVAVFFTYKANKDSVVFNMDAYRTFFTKLLGLRLKRHVTGKEVIIEDPDYAKDAADLQRLSEEVTQYAHAHKLMLPPNIIKVFFKYEPDHEIERISEEMEAVIEDLGNTKDKHIISMLNHYPVVSAKAHTRPFERRWMNIVAFILIPVGAFLYIRMWSFRLRLLRDLRVIKQTNTNIVNRINEKYINT